MQALILEPRPVARHSLDTSALIFGGWFEDVDENVD